MMTFTPEQLHTIKEALRVAADTYATGAYQMDHTNSPNFARQFRKQRADAQTLLTFIEDNEP
jgi:hypothetical protein